MSLEEVLEKAAGAIQSGLLTDEAKVRYAVITPILDALGWDPKHPTELIVEYSVGNGWVDYALLLQGKPVVFVEAKRLGNLDYKAEDQLFNYASNRGVPILVLTDGQIWDFYLSMAAGEPIDRRFCRIEIEAIETGYESSSRQQQAAQFEKFLSKMQVISGKAKQEAEEVHNNIKRKEKLRQALPEAWERVLSDPGNLLIGRIAEEVFKLCGSKTEDNEVVEFLRQQIESITPLNSNQLQVSSPFENLVTENEQVTRIDANLLSWDLDAYIAGCELYSKELPGCTRGVGTMVPILKKFQEEDPGFLDRLYNDPRNHRGNARMVARLREELFTTEASTTCYKDLGGGWWASAKRLSNADIVERIAIFCDVAGIEFGTDLILIVKPWNYK